MQSLISKWKQAKCQILFYDGGMLDALMYKFTAQGWILHLPLWTFLKISFQYYCAQCFHNGCRSHKRIAIQALLKTFTDRTVLYRPNRSAMPFANSKGITFLSFYMLTRRYARMAWVQWHSSLKSCQRVVMMMNLWDEGRHDEITIENKTPNDLVVSWAMLIKCVIM